MSRYAMPFTKGALEQRVMRSIAREDFFDFFDKDKKVVFDFENVSIPVDDYDDFCNDVVGFYQLNGFEVALCAAGGDGEFPVCFVVYIDDKNKLRMYIPTLGNTWNKFSKTAFGSEEETDKGAAWIETVDDADAYEEFKDYIYDSRNKEAMLADVANRICVRGNAVVPVDPAIIDADNERWATAKTMLGK